MAVSRRSIAAGIGLVMLLGCSRDERSPERAAPPRALVEVPQDGGTLVRRLEADVSSLNPILATSRYDRLVANYLFTPVLYLDRDLQPIVGLAQSWEISEDGLLYRFRLHENATFSDGTPVRASDVVFTLRKIIDPATQAVQIASGFEYLDSERTRAVDDLTVEVAFRRSLASQLARFNDVLVLPERIYGKGDFRKDFNRVAVGSGPYRLTRYEPGREVVLERRYDFWSDRPHLERVVFRIIADHGTAWNALRRGDIDETFMLSETWLRERVDPTLSRRIDFRRFYTLNYNAIAWNARHPILGDGRVRRALASSIPTDSIVKDLYQGTARAMNGPFTPDQFAFNPKVPAIRYDPVAAKRLLSEAGYEDLDGDGVVERAGRPLVLELMIMAGSPTTRQFAQMLQAEWKRIGVDLRITTLDSSTAIQRMMAGNFVAAYLSWDLDPDPDPFAILHSSQIPPEGMNFVYYRNAEADELIEQARRELDHAKRRDMYWRLHEVLAADQPYTWTVQGSSKWGISTRVRGVSESRGFGLFLWYPGEFAWWIPVELRTHDRVR